MESKKELKLVLFDIDHTIMDIGNSHKEAFEEAFKEVLDLELDFRNWKFHGYTDLQIIFEIMDNHNIKREPKKVEKIIELMIKSFKKKNLSHAKLMKGVPAILDELRKKGNIITGLVTGNIEEIAYIKLKHFKIDESFLVGGFGDFSDTRCHLVEQAIKKTEAKFGKIKKSNVYIIGDTPHDIRAAHDAGVKAIAVATGAYSHEQLKEKEPDYLFETLKDTKRIIEVINNG
jgi:phosphoglycolate phosphatase-like HAD superfamily hydrolase